MNLARRFHFPEIDSTHSWSLRELDAGRLETLPVLITAGKQTNGRGQKSRLWFSPAGALLFSLVFAPEDWGISLRQTPLLSLACALAVLETVSNVLPTEKAERLKIHWPNDLYFQNSDSDFRKISGILTERHVSGAVTVGIGINLLNSAKDAPSEVRSRMLSLSDLTCDWPKVPVLRSVSLLSKAALPAPLEHFLALLLESMDQKFQTLGKDSGKIVQETEKNCLQVGKSVTLQTPQGILSGYCSGLAADGALLIDGIPCRNGIIHFHKEESF